MRRASLALVQRELWVKAGSGSAPQRHKLTRLLIFSSSELAGSLKCLLSMALNCDPN